MCYFSKNLSSRGFTLAEVILATGILGVAVLALVGLMGPTLERVQSVVETSRIVNATTKVEAYLDEYVRDPERGFERLHGLLDSDSAEVPIYVWDEPLGAPGTTANSLSEAIDVDTKVSENFSDIPTSRNDISGPILVFVLSKNGTGAEFEAQWLPGPAVIQMTHLVTRAEVHEIVQNPPAVFERGVIYGEDTFIQVIPIIVNR
ncbi:MAG: prepilin-type N-terminal cleavage/methylation domain-containing protein [Opitutales bacterium]